MRPRPAQNWLEIFSGPHYRFDSADGLAANLSASHAWAAVARMRIAKLEQITHPVLSIGFEYDVFFPAVTREAAAALIPEARHVTIAGAGHGGTITHGADLTHLITAFIAAD